MTGDFLAAWMYAHPRLRRVWLMLQLIWGGSVTAVVTAPRASADGITAVCRSPACTTVMACRLVRCSCLCCRSRRSSGRKGTRSSACHRTPGCLR